MLSYHNDPGIKAEYEARFAAHRAADEVIQGTGFDNGRGCFVGCTLDAYKHDRFPVELGWPTWLAHLADVIFEGVPAEEAPQFGTDLLAAVPVGVDLEPVRHRFLTNVQRRNLARLAGNTAPYADEIRRAIKWVIAEPTSASAISWAKSAARLAEPTARSAAWSAAEAAESAMSAAQSAHWSARSEAESAARSAESAAMSAYWSSRSEAEYQTQRDDLLAILRALENK